MHSYYRPCFFDVECHYTSKQHYYISQRINIVGVLFHGLSTVTEPYKTRKKTDLYAVGATKT